MFKWSLTVCELRTTALIDTEIQFGVYVCLVGDITFTLMGVAQFIFH